ncbi:MAG: LysM peptidoglycan-binding domain-containing protein, partial [Chloroflexi bacterium]|nr:LysM peptidoglycan-binding domain-containing protein [Chloroflexota bacterium]
MKNGIIPLRMSPEKPTSQTKICPTCGTRLADNATRCLVCGSEFTPRVEAKSRKSVQGSRMPEIRLSLPLALTLLVLILGLGAGGVFAGLQFTGNITVPTVVPTITETPTATPTPTETLTPTPSPTFTPLPPIDYVVQANDTCSGIALVFGVSVQSIIIENNLSST